MKPLSTGTNVDGQCVIEMSAVKDATAAPADAWSDTITIGTHTIVLVAQRLDGGTRSTRRRRGGSVEIQVGGAPATIESDAPERIDPSAEITVNVTVLDDELVAWCVNIEVIHTAGDGAIITDIAKTGPPTGARSSPTSRRPRRAWSSSSSGRRTARR